MREFNRKKGNIDLSAFHHSNDLIIKKVNGKEVLIKHRDLSKVIGKSRMENYRKNGRSVAKIAAFFINKEICQYTDDGLLANLIGDEGNLLTAEELVRLKAKEVQTEIPYLDTRIDVLAKIYKNIRMDFITKDWREINKTLPEEYNAFEVKASVILPEKVKWQMVKIRGRYKNCHCLVLADTKISKYLVCDIYDAKCDIIRAPFSRQDILNRLLKVQKDIRALI